MNQFKTARFSVLSPRERLDLSKIENIKKLNNKLTELDKELYDFPDALKVRLRVKFFYNEDGRESGVRVICNSKEIKSIFNEHLVSYFSASSLTSFKVEVIS